MNAQPVPVRDLLNNAKRKDFKLEKPLHAIVVIHGRMPSARDVHYMVTLDPAKFSPSKAHIRLGDVKGDEFTGWVPSGDIEIKEILGEFDANEAVPYADVQQWNVQ